MGQLHLSGRIKIGLSKSFGTVEMTLGEIIGGRECQNDTYIVLALHCVEGIIHK